MTTQKQKKSFYTIVCFATGRPAGTMHGAPIFDTRKAAKKWLDENLRFSQLPARIKLNRGYHAV